MATAVVAQLALVAGEAAAKVHGHSFASAAYNSIGIHPPLLECLKNNNIDFTIHAPSGA